jgi:hypothetical protein
MKHKGSRRRQRRLEQLARWLEELWSCDCAYHNVASFRCYGCGARPPRPPRRACAQVVGEAAIEDEDQATTPAA